MILWCACLCKNSTPWNHFFTIQQFYNKMMTKWGMFAMQVDIETWNFGIVQCSFAKFHLLFFLLLFVFSSPNFCCCFSWIFYAHLAEICGLQVSRMRKFECQKKWIKSCWFCFGTLYSFIGCLQYVVGWLGCECRSNFL